MSDTSFWTRHTENKLGQQSRTLKIKIFLAQRQVVRFVLIYVDNARRVFRKKSVRVQ